ncbi:RICIN domain-containing protein [Actinoplanes sp. NPDC051513]|uniref:RICIN domain-containing protein n=1 Tax=Actinoplanes sp. NPDC051513 TaxID=3363908 RepID=UPI0037BAE606
MRIRRKILAAAMSGVATLALIVSTGGAAHAAPIQIWNHWTGLCLQPASYEEFAAVVQKPCDDAVDLQAWTFQRVTGTRYKFWNPATDLCLNEFDPLDFSARVLMVGCARVSNEEWQTHVTLPHGAFPLESRSGNTDTQYCIDANLGDAVLMWGCLGSPSQNWAVL